MLNQTVIVGRLARNPKVTKLEDGKRVSNITLAVPRSYKNEKGEYETDFITCELWNGVAINTAEYCKQGDILGVKGRIKTDSYENESGEKVYKTSIVAEKVTFLSSKYKESKTDNDMEV